MKKENSTQLLKLYFDEKTKRCSLPLDFESLKEMSIKSFQSLEELSFELFYMDDENDMIQIENEFDYKNSTEYLKQSKNNTLKVIIRVNDQKFDPIVAIKFLENSNMGQINLSEMVKQEIVQNEINKLLEEQESSPIFMCESCGRKFCKINSYEKHQSVCSKVFGSKRKPFNSKKQRLMIEDHQEELEIMNSKITNQMTQLKEALNKWNVTCQKLENNFNYYGRPFKDLYVEADSNKCNYCSRNFNHASYKKHVKNCFRLYRKRKPFDSRKQRLISLEQAYLLKKQENMRNNFLKFDMDQKDKDAKSRPRWKRLSERFRIIMRIAKLLNMASK
jgi:hypothetical protein